MRAAEDAVPEMVRQLVADGIEVRAMIPAAEQGLEDFFLELTGTDGEGPAPTKRRAGLARLLPGGRR